VLLSDAGMWPTKRRVSRRYRRRFDDIQLIF
jgi:hypothetical protein